MVGLLCVLGSIAVHAIQSTAAILEAILRIVLGGWLG